MSEGVFPPRERCAVHDLALGPGGACVRCRRDADRRASRRVLGRFAGGVSFVLVLAIGYRGVTLRRTRSERPRTAASPDPPPPSAGEVGASEARPRPSVASPSPRADVPPAWPAPAPAPSETAAPADEAPAAQAQAAAAHQRALESAMRQVDVVVYTTSWCPSCKQARSWMNQSGIAYSERDIDQDHDAHEKLKSMTGHTTIPTFDIEGQVHVGFNPSWVQSTIRSVAERRIARDNF